MSVTYFDPETLWILPCDEFNEWRVKNDIPLLLAFFLTKLPSFQEWLDQFKITPDIFCRTVPTGALFVGTGNKLLVLEHRDGEKHSFYRYWEGVTKERHEWVSKEKGEPAAKYIEILPYFYWAKKMLGRKRFFNSNANNKSKVDTISFGRWDAVDTPTMCRASLFSEFQVLKLGGVLLGSGKIIGGRNLDFADLDYLIIQDKWHGNWESEINFSSCRLLTIRNTMLHHFSIRHCNLENFSCTNSELQNFTFQKCTGIYQKISDCRLIVVRFIECVPLPDITKCELRFIEYKPSRNYLPSGVSDEYRRLRVAYQEMGKRHEASECYYLERKFERKHLFSPYAENSKLFPQKKYGGTVWNSLESWWKGQFPLKDSIKYVLDAMLFHVRVWTSPRSFFRALAYKYKYFASLFEEVLWGYGERPSRIFFIALTLIATYAGVYYFSSSGLSEKFTDGSRLANSIYFSTVTFTTLGYGDIIPVTNHLKMICASEALSGAFLIGIVIAGFSNKSRY